MRDLQVWHKLVWIDPFYRGRRADSRALPEGTRIHRRGQARHCATVELEILRRVIPEYRAALERGQVELSTSPFYHPILPLLCDIGCLPADPPALGRMPRRAVPPSRRRRRAARSGPSRCTSGCSAAARRALALGGVGLGRHGAARARAPASPGWRQTRRSWRRRAACVHARRRRPSCDQPRRSTGPYRGRQGKAHGRVRIPRPRPVGPHRVQLCVLVGREAPRTTSSRRIVRSRPPLGRAHRRGRADHLRHPRRGERLGALRGPGPAVPAGALLAARVASRVCGRSRCPRRAPRRRSGCRRSSPGPGSTATSTSGSGTPTTIGPGASSPRRVAPSTSLPGLTTAALARAREEMLIAEGSDWFWWYGDDHSSDHDLAFDELFRRHVRNIYRRARRSRSRRSSSITNITTEPPACPDRPADRVHPAPAIDGEITSYFEWMGAGCVEARDVGGAMHQVSSRARPIERLEFGCDLRAPVRPGDRRAWPHCRPGRAVHVPGLTGFELVVERRRDLAARSERPRRAPPDGCRAARGRPWSSRFRWRRSDRAHGRFRRRQPRGASRTRRPGGVPDRAVSPGQAAGEPERAGGNGLSTEVRRTVERRLVRNWYRGVGVDGGSDCRTGGLVRTIGGS